MSQEIELVDKECRKCGFLKKTLEFPSYKDRGGKLYTKSTCKQCARDYSKARNCYTDKECKVCQTRKVKEEFPKWGKGYGNSCNLCLSKKKESIVSKQCSICNQVKDISQFGRHKGQCKACLLIKNKKWIQSRPENKIKYQERAKEKHRENPEIRNSQAKKSREKHKEKRNRNQREKRRENPELFRQRENAYNEKK